MLTWRLPFLVFLKVCFFSYGIIFAKHLQVRNEKAIDKCHLKSCIPDKQKASYKSEIVCNIYGKWWNTGFSWLSASMYSQNHVKIRLLLHKVPGRFKERNIISTFFCFSPSLIEQTFVKPLNAGQEPRYHQRVWLSGVPDLVINCHTSK